MLGKEKGGGGGGGGWGREGRRGGGKEIGSGGEEERVEEGKGRRGGGGGEEKKKKTFGSHVNYSWNFFLKEFIYLFERGCAHRRVAGDKGRGRSGFPAEAPSQDQ